MDAALGAVALFFGRAIGAGAGRAATFELRELLARGVAAEACGGAVVTGGATGAAGAAMDSGAAAIAGDAACARIGVLRRSASANRCAAARVRTKPAE